MALNNAHSFAIIIFFYLLQFQRLEDSVLKDSEDYTVKGEDNNPSKIPARIREIITKNLSPGESEAHSQRMSAPTTGQLQEENRLLASELNRVEDLLAASRAERDELGIKYNALSDKVGFCLLLFFYYSEVCLSQTLNKPKILCKLNIRFSLKITNLC